MFFAHFSEKTAVGTSVTLLMLPVGYFAAHTYWKHGNVNFRAVLWILLGFIVSSYFAARLGNDLPASTLERIFGLAAIIIGIKMLISA
jgi:uncharacterized membrane protein YfcA